MKKENAALVNVARLMMSNMSLRIISGFILAAIFVVALLSKIIFMGLIFLLATMMLSEWYDMSAGYGCEKYYGYLMCLPALLSALLIRDREEGELIILLVMALICSVDIFAMLGGRVIKGAKLAPKLSPAKTWSGLLCGIIAANIMVSSILAILAAKGYAFYWSNIYIFLCTSLLAVLEQMSDLSVSYFKRRYGVKDSGNIIPGHGGVLDRFDGMLLILPVVLLFILYGGM